MAILEKKKKNKKRRNHYFPNSNHTRLTHGYLMKNEKFSNRTSCGVALTIKHVLTECLQFRKLRKEYHLSTNLYEMIDSDDPKLPSYIIFLLYIYHIMFII